MCVDVVVFPYRPGLCYTATQAAVLEIATCGLGCSSNKHCLSLCSVHPGELPQGGRRAQFTDLDTADTRPESCCFCRLRLPSSRAHTLIA